MRIVNLTPHDIVLERQNGERMVYGPEPLAARVATITGELGMVPGIPVPVAPKVQFGEVENLPDPVPGTIYIVSGIVGAAVSGRDDVFVPGTGPNDGPIRYPKGHAREGQIAAITRLNRV